MILLKAIGLLPIQLLYATGALFSMIIRTFYRNRTVLNNLQIAFPEKSHQEIKNIRRRFYSNFVDVVVEVLKTTSMSRRQIDKRVRVINPEVFNEEFAKSRSIMLFASHFANWEWAALAISSQTQLKIDPIYKVQANHLLDTFIYNIRARFGGKPIPKESAVRNILKNKDKVRCVGFVADQRPQKMNSKVWLNFMGVETAFFPGNISLPYITQFPCYYMKNTRVKRGYYEVEAIKLADPPHNKNDPEVLKSYIAQIEDQINENPADWLWTHKRWKYKRPEKEELLV